MRHKFYIFNADKHVTFKFILFVYINGRSKRVEYFLSITDYGAK